VEGKIMKKTVVLSLVLAAVCLAFSSCGPGQASGDSYAEVLEAFADPPAGYRSVPLWVWNDRVTESEVETQLADFKAHGIGGVFIHPRPGLITPYLSEEWLSLCRHAVDVGKSLGMKVWIYDENSYPSGFAGGHVPADMPDSRGLGLRMAKAAELPASFEEKPIVVLRRAGDAFENITEQAFQPGAGGGLGAGEYFIFSVKQAATSPWFGGYSYVDIMRRQVTGKFIDVTLNAYKRAIGDDFGGTVPGSFQDEAQIAPVGGPDVVNFTPGLFDRFQTKWGYDLRPCLPSLFEETGDQGHVRHNFYATLLDLFIENWARPYYDFCTANNLSFTGHYWEHEWPVPRVSPDNMAMAAYAHMPGIDCLMNQWQTGPHAQFGNARSVKEIRSAANQLGRPRTMSETYGAGGWDLTFYDQKRIADWEFALGVNFIDQHLSYVTIMGARKRDHPQSFSYHEPWWPAYRIMGDYLGRLAVAMSKGQQVNHILVIEPTTTAWMYYSPATRSERLEALGNGFQGFINRLEAEQIEYDLGSEDILRNHARAENKRMVVGERSYDIVVLPTGLDNLNERSVELLSRYLDAGGKVLALGGSPRYVDGAESRRPAELAAAQSENWLVMGENEAINMLAEACAPEIRFSNVVGDRFMFFHHRRELSDAELVFLANISPEKKATGKFSARGRSAETWDPFTGKAAPYPSSLIEEKLEVSFDIPPGGSLLLCLRKKTSSEVQEKQFGWREIAPEGGLEVRPGSPNVLTIDYCDLRLGDKLERDLYFYDAQRKTFEAHGLARNPWDSAVQYKTNILDLDRFPPDSGFEAAFRFTANPGADLSSLRLAVERPSLYHVSINGKEVEAVPGDWWLDRAFGVFEIGKFSVAGKNEILLRARPFTIFTELEPVYLLGDFGLEGAQKGFMLVPAEALQLGPWSEQGMPFFGGGVAYTGTWNIEPQSTSHDRYFVRLGRWRGSVAEVRVNGKTAGFIAFEPFELEITDALKFGPNTVSVMVFGTLKNTLGPHHNNPPLGTAWPGMFQKGAEGGRPAGSEYSVVGYGLFEGFKILARTEK
jgi:hypothetical protein